MTLFANRYEKIKVLGKGMAGEVFLVKDQKTGRLCALKILLITKRFQYEGVQHEFETLKNLNHPSIAKVFDAGIIEKTRHLYLATEFIEGSDLFHATEVKSVDEIEDILVQALRALNYLHNQKTCHLDLKPQNLLVTSTENNGSILKIIDFGLANFYQRETSQFEDKDRWIIAGTAAYVPPEIIQGEPPDGRSDLYSLGCTFFKAFTRELPFTGDQHEIHEKHLYSLPPIPSSLNANIPEYLNKVLLKLLEKDKEKRYQSAQAVIEDLNLLSEKQYPIETPQTMMSYIPEKGKLIGREDEFDIFETYYYDRVYGSECTKKPYLIVKGAKGTGKSRFLQECKHLAQKHFKDVLSWTEFMSLYTEEGPPNPTLIIGDDQHFDSYDLEFLDAYFEKKRLLVVFSTQSNVAANTGEVIELKNFTIEQTKEYLVKASGLHIIPENIISTIHKRTSGNPLYLTEYVRALFEKGFFRDEGGGWTQNILEDLGIELETLGATEFIKKRLREKLDDAQLDSFHLELLNMMALTGKPTLDDLVELTNPDAIEKHLKFLAQKEILEVDVENRYIFSNPAFIEVLMERMDPLKKAEYCDNIADFYEQKGLIKEKILYYRGRGAKKNALQNLLELSKIQKEHLDYLGATDSLKCILDRKEIDKKSRLHALIEMGELCIEMGRFSEAEEWLKKIIDIVKEGEKAIDIYTIYLKALEQLGVSFKRRDMIEQATQYYEKGLKAINNQKNFLWMEVVFKNRLAQNELHCGNIENAERIFNETWNIWEKKLNEEEKVLAIRTDIDLVYYIKGEYEKAIAYLERVLEFLSMKPSLEAYPITLYKLGQIYAEIGDFTKGEVYLQKCLETVKTRKTPHWHHLVYNELGNLYERKNDSQKSLSYYLRALELAKKKGSTLHLCIISYNIANFYLQTKSLDEARKYFDYIIKKLRSIKTHDQTQAYYLYVSLIGVSSVYREQGEFYKASTFLDEAMEVMSTNTNLKIHQQYYWQENIELYNAKGLKKDAQKAYENLVQIRNEIGFNEADYKKWLENIDVTSFSK